MCSLLLLKKSEIFQCWPNVDENEVALKISNIFGEYSSRIWEDNIKRDLQEVGGGCEDWMEGAQDRDRWRALLSTVMNFRVP
jgi:hypothetical protein